MTKKITQKEVNDYAIKIKKKENAKYNDEYQLITNAIKAFPKNTDPSIVAMKIALIDLTHGTNLLRNLGKASGLNKLTTKITEINFDERINKPDFTLVNELIRFTKENIGKNLGSFITKYCFYHNEKEYSIYDDRIVNNIGKYIPKKNLSKKAIRNLIKEYKYEEYIKIINSIIKENHLTGDDIHRKLDWFLWHKFE